MPHRKTNWYAQNRLISRSYLNKCYWKQSPRCSISKLFLSFAYGRCAGIIFSGKVTWTMSEKQRMVQRQKEQFHLPNMNTIRRSGSIFLTPFPISTTTFGFSTIVFRRLKSNLEPSFSSFSLGVLVPQPIVAVKAQSRQEWLNYRCQDSAYKTNIHCRTNDEYKQTTNDLPTSRPTRTLLRARFLW